MSAQSEPSPAHNALRRAREAAGLSLFAAAVAIREHLPERYWQSPTNLGRLETAHVRRLDPVLVAGLAAIYGTTVAAIDPSLAEDAKRIAWLLTDVDRPTPPVKLEPKGRRSTRRGQPATARDVPSRGIRWTRSVPGYALWDAA